MKKIKFRRIGASLTIAIVATPAAASTNSSAESAGCQMEKPLQNQTQNHQAGLHAFDISNRDVEEYAKQFALDLTEAKNQLEQMSQLSRLNQSVADRPDFGGLWVEHLREGLCVHIATTSANASGAFDQQIAGAGIDRASVAVVIHSVKRTIVEIQAQITKLRSFATAAPFDLDIDLLLNAAVLSYSDRAAFDEWVTKTGATVPDDVAKRQVENISIPNANFWGGQWLSNSGCTSAFTIVNIFGIKGVLSAGHCGNSAESYQGVATPFISEQFQGRRDVQYYSATGSLVAQNKFFDGTCGICVRSVSSVGAWSGTFNGQYLCHYGHATGYGCGTVYSTTAAPGYVPTAEPFFLKIHSDTSDLSQGGDSGGPWFVGNQAWGVHSGGAGPNTQGRNDAIIMAINWVDTLGVSVLTS